jgi:preprotein translocase subunit YajC
MYAMTILQAQSGQGGGMTMLLMLALIFVVMWLFMIRPQQKRQKELNKFRDSLAKGDKVVTVGGIYGTVVEVNDNKVMLEIDKDVKIKVDKASLVKDFSDAQQA